MQDFGDDQMTGQPEPETDYDDQESGNGPVPLTAGANCDRFTFVLYVLVLGAL